MPHQHQRPRTGKTSWPGWERNWTSEQRDRDEGEEMCHRRKRRAKSLALTLNWPWSLAPGPKLLSLTPNSILLALNFNLVWNWIGPNSPWNILLAIFPPSTWPCLPPPPPIPSHSHLCSVLPTFPFPRGIRFRADKAPEPLSPPPPPPPPTTFSLPGISLSPSSFCTSRLICQLDQ